MSGAVAGIDPHQDTLTVDIIGCHGVELTTVTFPNHEIRDQMPTTGTIESRLRKLEAIDAIVSTQAGADRLSWLLPLIDQGRATRRQVRALERRIDQLLDAHGTTLRDEAGIGPIAAGDAAGRGR